MIHFCLVGKYTPTTVVDVDHVNTDNTSSLSLSRSTDDVPNVSVMDSSSGISFLVFLVRYISTRLRKSFRTSDACCCKLSERRSLYYSDYHHSVVCRAVTEKTRYGYDCVNICWIGC